MFETREIVTTHWVALEGTQVTFSEPWAAAVPTNVDAPIPLLRSAATAKRDENLCHFMRASYGADRDHTGVLPPTSSPGGTTKQG
jgi:hypothetical protein